MGTIRYETIFASATFVHALRESGRMARMLHNGVDIVLFETSDGQPMSAHFIDSALPLYEIRNVLHDNASRGIATLYLLWADMMLPAHGQTYVADDWMEALYTLYGDSIYAYEILQDEAYLFPVHFRGAGLRRVAEFGSTVRFAALTARRVSTYLAGLHGEWWVADFGGAAGFAHDESRAAARLLALSADFDLLGLTPAASLSDVKTAYRHLARRFHPDLNASPEANDFMLRLNAAYDRLTSALAASTRRP